MEMQHRHYEKTNNGLVLPRFSQSPFKEGNKFEPKGDFYLQWPVAKVNISQVYRPRSNQRHEGIDLTHFHGAPILAAHEGYVVYAGSGYNGYGNVIISQYSQRWASLYAHLHRMQVSEGQVVKMGEQIGTMGNTGRSTGTHLHFELLKDQLPVNPLDYLPAKRNRSYVYK